MKKLLLNEPLFLLSEEMLLNGKMPFYHKISPITYQLRGSLVGRRWQIVADSITSRDGGPSRFFTASLTSFWNLFSSSMCVVSKNWRPLQSWNLISITSTTHNTMKCIGQFLQIQKMIVKETMQQFM